MDKYQEALERAKKGLPLDEVFPELKESEDDRILEWIIGIVNSCKELSFDDKVKLTKYLEKQKENPKSVDSISSDCTSDAKCENSWHKVADSLPDNPREVLCKDAIGNFFIGRYYKSTQSWEVVMYDDCDKDNEDNPPVVKWCEIPSEKQKEPLTPEEKMNHPLYLEGFDVGKKVGECVKERKPAEWSEEDKKRVVELKTFIAKCNGFNKANRQKAFELIDELRPQPHWKPSEE